MSRAPLDTRFNRLVVRVPEHGETFLRKLPYMSGLRVSNRDIEYMFRRSARAVRRKNAVNSPVGNNRFLIRRDLDIETRRREAENLALMFGKLNSTIDDYLNGTLQKGKEVEI